jgi:hypothetical protein
MKNLTSLTGKVVGQTAAKMLMAPQNLMEAQFPWVVQGITPS